MAMAQMVASLVMPVPLVLGLLFVGLMALVVGRRWLGGGVRALALVLLFLFSWQPFASLLIKPLERAYPPVEVAEVEDVEYVLVLGAGHAPDPTIPVSSRLPGMGMTRLAEGIRLHRALPGATLVTAGGGAPPSIAATAADVAHGLGVEEVETLDEPGNTYEEALAAGERFGDAPFILVTSASHMPRAMALFRAQGLDPTPAPTEYMAPERSPEARWNIYYLRPSATGLRMTERAFHEYLGLAWGRMRGIL